MKDSRKTSNCIRHEYRPDLSSFRSLNSLFTKQNQELFIKEDSHCACSVIHWIRNSLRQRRHYQGDSRRKRVSSNLLSSPEAGMAEKWTFFVTILAALGLLIAIFLGRSHLTGFEFFSTSENIEYDPKSEEELNEIIQKHSEENEEPLIYILDDDNMPDIPESKTHRKVNLSKLVHLYESQPESVSISRVLVVEPTQRMEALQKTVGPDPKVSIENFENWGKTQRAQVLATYPESLDQLKKLIIAARDMGLKIRCAGAKHSWAPLFADSEQLLIYMDKMNSDYPDKSKLYMMKNQNNTVDVHIMAGVKNEEFKTFQLDKGINIPCNVILTVVEVASVIVTGCHGVGKDCKCPSDYVVQMRIVDSNGQLKTYTKEVYGEEMMKAVIANFGLFGVVYDMTIRLESKQTFVKTNNEYFSVRHIFYITGVLEALVENNWSVELFWFPMNSWYLSKYNPQKDDVWVRLINKDDEGQNQFGNEAYYKTRKFWDKQSAKFYGYSQRLFKNCLFFPAMQRGVLWMLKKMYPTRDDLYEKLPHAVHFRSYIEHVPVNDMEFAFDLSEVKNYDLIRQAIQFVIDQVVYEFKMGRCPLNVAMEMRWISHSDAYLCPASIIKDKAAKDPKVLYIEILSLEGTKEWKAFSTVIGKKFMELGGVPHLAKEWEFLPDIQKHIREKFGNRIESFRQQLQRSGADGNKMFLNEGLKKLLYP